MDSFHFFAQGNFKKIATEQGLDRKYFIFQFIVCNLSAASTFCLMKIIHTYTILYILITATGVINGFLLRSRVLSIVKNKQKFLSDMFPLDIPFFFIEYKIPILARFWNRGMKWLYPLSFFCLFSICFSIYILNKEGGWMPYFTCYLFGFVYPLCTYIVFLSRDYKRIQP
ncbi:hypothetical protein A7Q03_04025 [Eikenella sp. NML99-0057]|uniref:hypothetical protein n=1 Tax=Eikenella sp. NML99-0057 TaxID=1795834 RepID=UPI0007E10B11|nr:hypothetical protein [Eikenella sp. NML99-0057]OAM45572.1 hypothetical protein A7Q03_04025 [Eikenella sp. NML99-0057]